ncbi:MAG: bacteriocin [Prevotellaceae bacterium]|nr:bacteriocin [Candidatus Faecinaster equi]
MKTKEELNALKNEVKDLNAKLAELSEEELKEVSGGMTPEEILEFMKQHHLIITKDESEFG